VGRLKANPAELNFIYIWLLFFQRLSVVPFVLDSSHKAWNKRRTTEGFWRWISVFFPHSLTMWETT